MNRKDELHAKALLAAKNFKESEKALQEILREIDQHRVFYDLGYRSLIDYAISGLTPDVAFNHCTVAKKSNDLPEIRKAVSKGILSVSAVRHMAPVLTKENELEMIGLASQLTQAELRREIARRNPEQSEVPEKARYVREDRLALELRVSEELMKKLRRAQDLVSQSGRKLSSLEETLEAMVDVFLEKRDPLKKAERAEKRNEKPPAQVPTNAGRIILKNKRSKPLSEGGKHQPENLTLLCSGHHRMIHRTSKTEHHAGPTPSARSP